MKMRGEGSADSSPAAFYDPFPAERIADAGGWQAAPLPIALWDRVAGMAIFISAPSSRCQAAADAVTHPNIKAAQSKGEA
jgi:hypothetical protein